MRKEASIEEWSSLYQISGRIKDLKPWERFWDLDLISIQEADEEDTVFFSILGRGGDCYGIAVYEGFEGLNDLMMLTMQERLNLSIEYTMFSQNNLTCYWGNREELSEEQRNIIKELGYKFRGKNQWLYFLSHKEGYYPYNMDQNEVQRMTHYMNCLEKALEYYENNEIKINFEEANMFCFEYNQKEKTWFGSQKELPFTTFQFWNLILTDEELIEDLRDTQKSIHILEADIVYLGSSVTDKKYERPAHPRLCIVADAKSGVVLKADMVEPEMDANVALVENIIGFIFQYGAPEEIRVSNVLMEAIAEQVCREVGIKLRKVKKLAVIDDFMKKMRMMR